MLIYALHTGLLYDTSKRLTTSVNNEWIHSAGFNMAALPACLTYCSYGL